MKSFQKLILSLFLLYVSGAVASENSSQSTESSSQLSQWGWSLDIGGQYTWMSLSTPPTYEGNTGGGIAKITYQKASSFFGQLRSFYNVGHLSSYLNSSRMNEWYTEFVGGYCWSFFQGWSFTPYAGMGFDFLKDHQSAFSSISATDLKYRIYYAVVGFDTHYTWNNWFLGLQVDCLPTFNQYLCIEELSGNAWTLSERVGVAARLPIGFRLVKNVWMELDPYYRRLSIGSSDVLGLSSRDLNQFGVFLTFRFFI